MKKLFILLLIIGFGYYFYDRNLRYDDYNPNQNSNVPKGGYNNLLKTRQKHGASNNGDSKKSNSSGSISPENQSSNSSNSNVYYNTVSASQIEMPKYEKPLYEQKPSMHGDSKCPSCENGKCNHCGGVGKTIKSEYDSDLGRSITVTDNCPICMGTGHCKVCYGRGYIHY